MREDLFSLALYAGCVAVVTIFCLVSDGEPFEPGLAWISHEAQSAATFFVASITAEEIQDTYQHASLSGKGQTKVRVLIMPGHQPTIGGTAFGGVYERDLVVEIADALALIAERNPRYDVMVARSKSAWHPTLQTYFNEHAPEILAFQQSQERLMNAYLSLGSIRPSADQVSHNTTSSVGALQLYGINMWANENDFDIVLHLHINDYAGRRSGVVGKYDGFTIYVPDHQYSNAEASAAIARSVAGRLSAYHATSTLPKENKGVVEDQELIAIGSNNTADSAAMLIEYGYIYEPQFQDPEVRQVAVTDYAYQTYLGLQDFFNDAVPRVFGSVVFPYDWSRVESERGPGMYALQAALHHLGFYPSGNKDLSQCPISGVFGPCTRAAISAYQSARGIEVTGDVGPMTRTALENDLVSP